MTHYQCPMGISNHFHFRGNLIWNIAWFKSKGMWSVFSIFRKLAKWINLKVGVINFAYILQSCRNSMFNLWSLTLSSKILTMLFYNWLMCPKDGAEGKADSVDLGLQLQEQSGMDQHLFAQTCLSTNLRSLGYYSVLISFPLADCRHPETIQSAILSCSMELTLSYDSCR